MMRGQGGGTIQMTSRLHALPRVHLERTVASFGLGTLVAVNPPAIEIAGEALPDDTIGTHVPKL